MARFARVVAADTAHHVTQRGNARRLVFETDADRLVYLELLEASSRTHHLDVLGFCLMSNHVHLVVTPRQPDSLALALRHTHGRYAAFLNARQCASGHVWQGRYYSCPLDEAHFWAALRYTELNPVRAAIVPKPELYRWSSAAVHCGFSAGALPLHVETARWNEAWNGASWRGFLADGEAESDVATLRATTHTGRPLGSEEFVRSLERILHRSLAPQKGGRPRKSDEDSAQSAFVF